MPQTLREAFDTVSGLGYIPQTLPEHVVGNLNPRLPLRTYQREALVRFVHYLHGYPKRTKPSQLLFHMATGSGKTLVMAATILYLYGKGYRNFLFFVNSTTIIDKTRDNFLNSLSPKYLFAESLEFSGRQVHVREVQSFQSTHPDDISILFITIQGLHAHLNTPRENALTYEDLTDRAIVLFSDEAHHLNALTRSQRDLSQEELLEVDTWEQTVRRIFTARSENILLEFTATVDLDHAAIRQKYEDKIIFQYSLKEFREDGYSKEVKVHEADLPPIERALQAVIVSQYRRKVAEKNGLAIKPVLLMKSRIIKDSEAFEVQFHKAIAALDGKRLESLKGQAAGIVKVAFDHFSTQNIDLDDLAIELRHDFDPNHTVIVNSRPQSEKKQLIVNSLEDPKNEVRVVFTVNMLNEGWDVLNLFDIVRLYNTRDAKQGIPGKTTMSEAQLIGRGARYFPFQLDSSQVKDKRKYDNDLGNEVRVLEELYYHSAHNPRYIDELHTALVQTGILAPRTRTVAVRVKDSFRASSFWDNGVIFVNKRIRNERQDIFGFDSMAVIKRRQHQLQTGLSREQLLLDEAVAQVGETVTKALRLYDLGENVIRTALQRLPFYEFDNLTRYFPHLPSVNEFITSGSYLGDVVVDLTGLDGHMMHLTQEEKIRVAVSVLAQISSDIQTGTPDYVGTKVFEPVAIRYCVRDKTLHITVSEGGVQEYGIGMRDTTNPQLHLDLRNEAWYVYDENYGTSEEKHFVRFLHGMIGNLGDCYSEVYLIRNEKLFQIYRFSDGATVEPDFVMFAVEKSSAKPVTYQLFIEPKGQHLLAVDTWKQEFLKTIESEYALRPLLEDCEYKLVGLPFYNETVTKTTFEKEFKRVLLTP